MGDLCAGELAAMIPRRLIIVAPNARDHADGGLGIHHRLQGLCRVDHTLRDAMGLVRCGGLANAEQFISVRMSLLLYLFFNNKLSAVLNHLRIPLREATAFERLKVIVTLSRSFPFTYLFCLCFGSMWY